MTHPVEAIFTEMIDLVNLKAEDYADSTNVFSNFENTAMLTGLTVPQVFHVLISIKTERLRQLMSGKAPNFESMEDTLKDLANYSALWIAWERAETAKAVFIDYGPGMPLRAPGSIITARYDEYEKELTELFNRGKL